MEDRSTQVRTCSCRPSGLSGRIAGVPMSDENALVVLCHSRHGEAQVIRARLEDSGIPAALSYESAGIVYGLTVDGIGAVRVLVPRAYYDQARAVLADNVELNSGDVDDSW
ncbi:MAG TPA: DUF2007 domain-containing protein [Dehalococcoidia bacterium]|nr:DUF2007 domain-containing protein [Dehalococcoidia bacterium]